MKVSASVRKQCKGCQVVRNRDKKRVYIRCKTNKRHNQRQG